MERITQAMERMRPALDDLLERGLFTRDEIDSIIARRRNDEHMFARRTVLKADFLRAIQYELQLEAKRRARKKQLGLDRSSIGDFAGIKRVHFLFDRVLRKFGGDLDLWLRYLDFAKRTGSSKALSQIFPRMLQLHPRVPGVWVRAAAYEYEERGNVAAARTLLQRALRVNGKYSRTLWLEYFRLEFLYLQKVMARKSVLGVGGGSSAGAGGGSGIRALLTKNSLRDILVHAFGQAETVCTTRFALFLLSSRSQSEPVGARSSIRGGRAAAAPRSRST